MTDDDPTTSEHPALAVARRYRRQREEDARQKPVEPAARRDPTAALQRLRAAVAAGRWPHLSHPVRAPFPGSQRRTATDSTYLLTSRDLAGTPYANSVCNMG
jgi:hypothetical protein